MFRFKAAVAVIAMLVSTFGIAAGAAEARPPDRSPDPTYLPIVFVHGQSGSAQQFASQAMRFSSNGYPDDLLFAFEYNTNLSGSPTEDLDAFIDDVLNETGASQVYTIGHSRGTSVLTTYLEPPPGGADGSSKVAKYVNIDGAAPATLPGGVPTIGIWGEWNTAGSGFNRRGDTNAQIGPTPADNFYFASKSHTETATSAEAFAVMYEFLVGVAPATTDVVPQPPGKVEVSGRAVFFPENEGYDGATVQVWKIKPSTGQRVGSRPRASFAIDESGDFGPVKVNSRQHFEFTIVRPDGTEHHFYPEPFLRSDNFLRLNSSPPGGDLDLITPDGPNSTNLVIVRQREFWGDQGGGSDELAINGLNVLTAQTSPRSGVNLAVFVQDDGLDGQTDLGKGELFPFNFLSFLTAVDVFIPASPDASGTFSVTENPRDGGASAVINVANWPSDANTVTVQFRDYDQ